LILRISLILDNNTYIYNCPFWVLEFSTGFLSFLLKFFYLLRTSLLCLDRTGEKILEILAHFPELLISFFLLDLSWEYLGVNLAKTHCWNVLSW